MFVIGKLFKYNASELEEESYPLNKQCSQFVVFIN